MRSELKSAVIPSLLLQVGGRDYIVEFPLSAVIKAEEKTGRSLKNWTDWVDLPLSALPLVLEAGLSKHHPDVKGEDIQAICDTLNPEALDEVHYALLKLAFPRACSRLEDARTKGNASPNV